MISLEKYLRKEDQEELLKSYNINDFNKWLFETYDEITDNISEDLSITSSGSLASFATYIP